MEKLKIINFIILFISFSMNIKSSEELTEYNNLNISYMPNEIIMKISDNIEGLSFISLKITQKRFNNILQDLSLPLNDKEKIIYLLENFPNDFRKKSIKSNFKVVSQYMIDLARERYKRYRFYNTNEERLSSSFLWKNFLRLLFISKDLGNFESEVIIKKESDYLDRHIFIYDALYDDFGNDLLDESSIITFKFEQVSIINNEARRDLINIYKNGDKIKGVIKKNIDRAKYWENFSLESYLWE